MNLPEFEVKYNIGLMVFRANNINDSLEKAPNGAGETVQQHRMILNKPHTYYRATSINFLQQGVRISGIVKYRPFANFN
jgi:hypothetical protein